MRSVFLFFNALLLCAFSRAQSPTFAGRLIEYRPAPGQHINDPATGTPLVASNITNQIGNPLSLGSYGGYVVLGFNSKVANDPGNPYGVDFIIYGNASSNHAEPGIVKVMKDVNKNDLPDDTWYEIAGSEHFTKDYSQGFTINYLNPDFPTAADVIWNDNAGNSGKISKNSFHNQPYYPLNGFFPGISSETMSFSGSKLNGRVQIDNGIFVSLPYSFGYADNIPVNNLVFTGIPDNPYTVGSIEGDGGDAIDISWAIDSAGNYVELSEIDFVMIYTGVNESAGWLGEISTDIRGVLDVVPEPSIKGPVKLILPDQIPSKIALSDSLLLTGRVLSSGRPTQDEKILWESTNPSILQIKDNILIAKTIGDAEIKGSLFSDPFVFIKMKISVVLPHRFLFDNQTRFIKAGEIFDLHFSLVDYEGDPLIGLIPTIIVENEIVAEIKMISEDKISITGLTAGVSLISLVFPEYPQLNSSFEVRVTQKVDPIKVFFSLSNEKENIIPGKSYTALQSDILSFTNRHRSGFFPDKPFITLADVITSVLLSEGFGSEGKSFAFRQDEYGGEGLYVWQIGYDWEYQYGWGGSTIDDTHAKTWYAIINNTVFVSGFDTIKIFDGDRIYLKYIEDCRNPWTFVSVIPEKERVLVGETAIFQSGQIDVSINESGGIKVSGPYPVVNGRVLIESSVVKSESDKFTSNSGEFKLNFNQAGNHKVSIENSGQVIMEVLTPLSVRENEQLGVYPNPCYDFLTVTIPSSFSSELKLISTDGKTRLNKKIESGVLSIELNTSELEIGMYILELISSGRVIKKKIFKQ